MVNVSKILSRSWHILWNYRVLWIFGILLALTTGGGGGGNGGGNGGGRENINFDPSGPRVPPRVPADAPQWVRDLVNWLIEEVYPLFTHPEQHIATFVWIGIAFFLFILIVSILVALVRYPTETAVIRMVNDYEETGTKVGFRQGWKLGWSRRALRLWLLDLLFGLPIFAVILVMLGLGVVIFLITNNFTGGLGVVGTVAAIGIAFLGLFVLIVAAVFVMLLRNFFTRAIAVDDLGVFAAIRYGWEMFKRNWKSAGVVWLVMIGVGIAFGIATIIVFFLLIPAYLILLIPAGMVAFFPGLIAFGITSLFASGPLAWIIAALVAIPFFFTIVFSPLILVSGWYKIFEENVWTLTYREIKTLGNLPTPGVVSTPLD